MSRLRVVKVHLSGDDADVAVSANLIARLLPELSAGRCQVGEVSPAYPNRRSSGVRRYLDIYLLPGTGPATTAEPGAPAAPPPLPGGGA
ncbi:hypothetical protein ACFVH6_30445 [Spirillospora sp. NPDC127200]